MTERTRYQDNLSSYTTPNVHEKCPSGVETGTYTLSNYPIGDYRATTDVVIPNFRERSRKGEIFNNIFHSDYKECSAAFGTWKREYDNPTCLSGYKTHFAATPYSSADHNDCLGVVPTVDVTRLRTLAGTRAKANVMQPDVMGGLEYLERRKTARLLYRPVTALKEEIERIKRRRKRLGRLGRYRDVGQFIANNWLKYRYGVTPLVMSINELLELLVKEKASIRQTARGFAQDNGSETEVIPKSAFYWDTVSTIETERTVSVRSGVLYEQRFSMGQKLGLSINDTPSIAWELIPYSFVADWFVNTNDLIHAITPKANVNILAEWTTVKDQRNHDMTYEGTWNDAGGTNVSSPNGTYRIRRTITDRTPGLSVGFATTAHEITFERNIDFKRLADSFALILSNLRYR